MLPESFSLSIGIPLYHCVKKACTTLIDNESKLNELDRAGGDGDTGTTLARGAKGNQLLAFYCLNLVCVTTVK